MAHFIGSFTTNGTIGNRQIAGFPFLPTHLKFTVGQKNSTTENFVHSSEGSWDGTTSFCNSMFHDTTGGKVLTPSGVVIDHMNRVSGAITEVIKATPVSVDDNGGGDYGCTLNFSATVSGYRVWVEAEG